MITQKCQHHLEVSLQHFHHVKIIILIRLLGISPAGYPIFVSELCAGRASDRQVTKDCDILTLLGSGDDIMADRGFDVADDMPAGVGLNIATTFSEWSKSTFSSCWKWNTEDFYKIYSHFKWIMHVFRALLRIVHWNDSLLPGNQNARDWFRPIACVDFEQRTRIIY